MSSKRKIKRCYTSHQPAFKVSSCPRGLQGPPGPQGPGITPVYGSLYANANVAIPNTNVDFDTAGPFGGVIINTADNSITVNSSGVYTISFSTILDLSNFRESARSVNFIVTINGNLTTSSIIVLCEVQAFENKFDTVSRTDQLMLHRGDVIRVYIADASQDGDVLYFNAALVVTKVAD